MKLRRKLMIGIQTCLITLAFAVPAQAAINIGAPYNQTGSVVVLKPYYQAIPPVQSPSNATPSYLSTPAPAKIGSSIISLKNLYNPYGTSVTPAPTPVPKPTLTPAPTPTPIPSTQVPSLPTTQPAIPPVTTLTADEQLMIDMVNQERTAAGLNPVQVDLRLVAVARAKANDMKANNYFDHTSPTYGSPWAMMQQVGITVRWAGENLAGNKSVPGAMSAFMQSAGHRKNILDPKFTHLGVGIASGSAYGTLYVQEFLQQ